MLSCLNREFGRDNLLKSLSTSTILWFCELQHLVLHLSWAAAVHSLKAEKFTNTSEGTRWCFSKQKQLMQKKVTCLLGNVALKVSMTSCRSRILLSQKPEDDKEEPYHTAAVNIYIFIPCILLEEDETCIQQQADYFPWSHMWCL